jgi:hypothetical protein
MKQEDPVVRGQRKVLSLLFLPLPQCPPQQRTQEFFPFKTLHTTQPLRSGEGWE